MFWTLCVLGLFAFCVISLAFAVFE